MAMRKCTECGHVFIAHGPDGCTCGCTAVRGGLVSTASPTATDDMVELLTGIVGSSQESAESESSEMTSNEEIVRFERDDEGYLAWLAANPSGFVINCSPNPSPDYVVLHRASCMHISVPGDNMEHWTHQYIKVCAPKNGLLVRWCEESVGVKPSRCQACRPMSPGHR